MSLSLGPVSRRICALAAAAVVLGTGVVMVAPVGSPAAGASDRATLSLVTQSTWVTPSRSGGPATFTLGLTIEDVPAQSTVSVTLFPSLRTRSDFEESLRTSPAADGSGGTTALDVAGPVPVSSLQPIGPDRYHLQVVVDPTSTTTPAPAAGTPTLVLTCTPGDGSCTGVYPVAVSLLDSSGDVLQRFTTFLTYAETASADRLRLAWVVPLSASTSLRPDATDPTDAFTPLSGGTAATLEHLVAELHESAVPVTLEPVPRTLQALRTSGVAGQSAVRTLAALSEAQAGDETLTAGYVPFDLGALAAAGEPTEITAQVKAAESTLKTLGVATGSPSTWVLTGQVGPATGTGLTQVGATDVVVPDTDLDTVSVRSTWASTFQLALAGRGTVTAAAADGELTSQFTADPKDPALAAAQFLADLAMVHFELPDATSPRGLVAVPPAGWRATARFDQALLSGLQDNPLVQPVTLSTFFATVPPMNPTSTSDPGPTTRHLAPGQTDPQISALLAHRLSTARLELTAFARAVVGNPLPPVLTDLDEALLASEASYRQPTDLATDLASGLTSYDRLFADQVGLVRLSADRSSITLTARTGTIPVTVTSGASYTIEGTLTVSSAKFRFPEGSTQTLPLTHASNSVRIHVVARTLGDSPVTVTFTAPGGGLVFARGQLTVRSTATSIVGIVLTAVALAVLLGWWARTWWSGRRRRSGSARTGSPA